MKLIMSPWTRRGDGTVYLPVCLPNVLPACLPGVLPACLQVYLLFGGKTGWLGGKLSTLLKEQGKTVHLADSRLENRESVIK